MADKFDESLRELERANLSKKRSEFEGFKAVRSERINIPVNKIIFAILILAAVSFYFKAEITEKALPHIPEQYRATVEKILKPSEIQPDKAAVDPSANANPQGVQSAAPSDHKTTDKPKEKEFVRIDGKYYEKAHDNIYFINGKRVFYKDSRSSDQ